MTKKEIFSYYHDLPPWARGIVIVGSLVVTGIVTYSLYQRLKKPEDTIERDWANKVNDLSKKMTSSFPKEQYASMADSIYENSKYCLVGNSYGVVKDELMKLHNDLEVAMLAAAFGRRQGACLGFSVNTPLDILSWTKYVLQGPIDEMKLRAIEADWKKKGITYTF